MKSKYTRDVSRTMIDALKNGVFKPFVEFVRKNNKELALCFRGNDSEVGKIIIYRHNHVVWELSINRKSYNVKTSVDHCRFMENWKEIVEKLMGLGFVCSSGEAFAELLSKKRLIVERKDKGGIYYNVVGLKKIFTEADNYDNIYKFVEESYEIIKKIQDVYFTEKEPHDYFKEYYFDNGSIFYANPQPCVEKHAQQDLFMENHGLNSGLFIYDLEFAQPSIKGVTVNNNNKPDMFGIRYDSEGKAVAICMIEVKSTKSALTGKSGLEKHLEGMEEYLKIGREDDDGKKVLLIDDRRREACNIMNQYSEINLYTKVKYGVGSFDKLPVEIIFVFTNSININSCFKKGVTVYGFLCETKEFKCYKEIKGGRYVGDSVYAMKKVY